MMADKQQSEQNIGCAGFAGLRFGMTYAVIGLLAVLMLLTSFFNTLSHSTPGRIGVLAGPPSPPPLPPLTSPTPNLVTPTITSNPTCLTNCCIWRRERI